MSNYADGYSGSSMYSINSFWTYFNYKYGWYGLGEGDYMYSYPKSGQTITIDGQSLQLYQLYGDENTILDKGLLITQNGDIFNYYDFSRTEFENSSGEYRWKDGKHYIKKPNTTNTKPTTRATINCVRL